MMERNNLSDRLVEIKRTVTVMSAVESNEEHVEEESKSLFLMSRKSFDSTEISKKVRLSYIFII